ncbi:MAG: phosphoglycerate dehydrogenase [Fidelibacterota bacterium]
MMRYSLSRNRMEVLLLENVHPRAVKIFENEHFKITHLKNSIREDELKDVIAGVHILGIRSRTKISSEVLDNAENLLTVGCFCIGTDQVDLERCGIQGIPVFNAPYSNTRSVAELVIAEIIMLLRGIAEKNSAAHLGRWLKSAYKSHECRGKTLGIIGYGHIGSQVSILAESLGMNVIYYDIVPKLSIGNASPVSSLNELLQISDVVTLHVPENDTTRNMISAEELQLMKRESYLINTSRGSVVDLEALKTALEGGKIAGAAIDVFPEEPKSTGDSFDVPLKGFPNVILTPHIGGSTQEAQENIAVDTSKKLIKYIRIGSTTGSVNMPQVEVPSIAKGTHRILHIHRNVPGVLSSVNAIFSKYSINVAKQYLETSRDIGYVIIDVEGKVTPKVEEELRNIDTTIRTRVVF